MIIEAIYKWFVDNYHNYDNVSINLDNDYFIVYYYRLVLIVRVEECNVIIYSSRKNIDVKIEVSDPDLFNICKGVLDRIFCDEANYN